MAAKKFSPREKNGGDMDDAMQKCMGQGKSMRECLDSTSKSSKKKSSKTKKKGGFPFEKMS
jgi:hypothetical protein